MITPPKNTNEFKALVEVVAALRGPQGCPWDKEQTHQTLTQYAIEEAHELAEAIDKNNQNEIIEELGDLLLQVILHTEIAKQEGRFDLSNVIQSITQKMIRRHPHVFGDVQVSGSKEVLQNWAKIKASEKTMSSSSTSTADARENSLFANIPRALPALLRAQKIGAKSVRYNFDWEHPLQVLAKVEEELAELKEAMSEKNIKEQQLELGDLLFSVVQLARHLNFDAEQALRMTNQKFEIRFAKMYELVAADNKNFVDLPASELEKYWQKAKLLCKDVC
jgi:tetrapyrrole methylase family protein/MazG family protein